jgi:tRNA A-37 threonylcarbamoyl transferase component Bud32
MSFSVEERGEGALSTEGYRWRIAPSVSRESLLPILEAFPGLEVLPGSVVLKSNHFRTVFRLPSPPGPPAFPDWLRSGLIAKVYRYTTTWDRLRYRWLRHRAEQERSALERFAGLELPAPRFVGVAELRRGSSVVGGGLLLEFLGGTVSLGENLRSLSLEAGGEGRSPGSPAETREAPSREARDLLERLGLLVRALHERGVWHRDLHAGNILFRRADGALFFVDLHSCLFFRGLARWQRRRGLVKLVHSLRGTVGPEGVRVLLESYGAAGLLGERDPASAERSILEGADKLERTRVRSRSRRCFLPSTLFTVRKGPGWRLHHLRAWPPEALDPLWTREPPGRCLKRSSRGWVAAVSVDGKPLCVKYRRYTRLEMLESLVESHRLRRAYAGGHALAVRRVATPAVVALRERRWLGMVLEAHLVTVFLEDAVPLHELLLGEYWGRRTVGLEARRRHFLARALGRFLRSIHDRGLYLHDLSPQNVLVSPGGIPDPRAFAEGGEAGPDGCPPFLHLADLDHLYLWKPLWPKGKLRNLSQLGNLPEGHVHSSDLFRALRAYASASLRDLDRRWLARLRDAVLDEHLRVLLTWSRKELAGVEPRECPDRAPRREELP